LSYKVRGKYVQTHYGLEVEKQPIKIFLYIAAHGYDVSQGMYFLSIEVSDIAMELLKYSQYTSRVVKLDIKL
jgi:hypothetical protein